MILLLNENEGHRKGWRMVMTLVYLITRKIPLERNGGHSGSGLTQTGPITFLWTLFEYLKAA